MAVPPFENGVGPPKVQITWHRFEASASLLRNPLRLPPGFHLEGPPEIFSEGARHVLVVAGVTEKGDTLRQSDGSMFTTSIGVGGGWYSGEEGGSKAFSYWYFESSGIKFSGAGSVRGKAQQTQRQIL